MVRRLVVGVAFATLVGAGCSGGDSSDEASPSPTAIVTATAIPTPTSTPVPSPTPVPLAVDVISSTTPTNGSFELAIGVGTPDPDMFRLDGRYDSAVDAAEVTFELEAFLAFAAIADPLAATDPLVSAAPEVLGGTWVVRRVDTDVYVQQPFLVESAGGEDGDWLAVDDPAATALLTSGGLLSGGLYQQSVHDLLRTAGGVVTDFGTAPTKLAVEIDGARASVGGRDAAATAAFVGIPNLDQVVVPAVVTVDERGLVTRVALEIPEGGFGEASPPATLDVAYVPERVTGLAVPEGVVSGPASTQ